MKIMILIMVIWMPLDIVVFFVIPDGRIDHLIGDGSVKIFFFFL